MIKQSLLFLLVMLLSKLSFCQKFVNVIDQTIIVNSTSNLTGSNRSYISVNFPERTGSYLYRLTTTQKEASSAATSLYDLLKPMVPSEIQIGVALANLVVKTNDGYAIDAFTFTNIYDAQSFVQRRDGDWRTCSQSFNVMNTCYATNQCLNHAVYYGFRNNNLMAGLKVRLEVVAIVDTTTNSIPTNSFAISNASNQEATFMMSENKANWEKISLRSGYSQYFTNSRPKLYFRIYTSLFNFVTYEIDPKERYKIIQAANGKWDLVKY